MRQVSLPFLVVIRRAIVLIKHEVAISPRIDSHLGDFLLFVRTFYRFAERQNGTRSNKQRYRIDRRSNGNRLAAVYFLIRPEVVPVSPRRQIDREGRWPPLRSKGDQQQNAP